VFVAVLQSAVLKLNQLIIWLKQLESHQRVKEALYLQVQLQWAFRVSLVLTATSERFMSEHKRKPEPTDPIVIQVCTAQHFW